MNLSGMATELLGVLIRRLTGIDLSPSNMFNQEPDRLRQIVKTESDRLCALLTAVHPTITIDWPPTGVDQGVADHVEMNLVSRKIKVRKFNDQVMNPSSYCSMTVPFVPPWNRRVEEDEKEKEEEEKEEEEKEDEKEKKEDEKEKRREMITITVDNEEFVVTREDQSDDEESESEVIIDEKGENDVPSTECSYRRDIRFGSGHVHCGHWSAPKQIVPSNKMTISLLPICTFNINSK